MDDDLVATAKVPDDGKWHEVRATYDGTNLRIEVDPKKGEPETEDPSDIGTHAKPGDVLIGRLTEPIGMYRDEVYLRDLSPEAQALLKAALDWSKGRYYRIKLAAEAFNRSVKR